MSTVEARLLGLAVTLEEGKVRLDDKFFSSQGSYLMELCDAGQTTQEELRQAAEKAKISRSLKNRQKQIHRLDLKRADISTKQGSEAFDIAGLITYFNEVETALFLGVSLGHLSPEEADRWRERFLSGHPWAPPSSTNNSEHPIDPLSFSFS